MKIIIKIVLIFFLFNHQINAHSEEKIAYINLEDVIQNKTYGKKILKKLNIENEKNISNLKIFENELQSIESTIKKKQNIITQEEYDSEINKLKIKIKNYNNEKNQLVNKFKQLKSEELNIFLMTSIHIQNNLCVIILFQYYLIVKKFSLENQNLILPQK